MQQRAAAFGRKGQTSASSEMDRRREAFIAAERARRAQKGHRDAPVERDQPEPGRPGPHKSVGTAYILWFVLGAFSGHRFYLGKASIGFAQICLRLVGALMFLSGETLGLYLIAAAFLWWIADAVMLPDMVRKANLSSGRVFA